MDITYKDIIIANSNGLLKMMHTADIRNRIDVALWYLDFEESIEGGIKSYNAALKKITESYDSFIKKDKDGVIILDDNYTPVFIASAEKDKFLSDLEELKNSVACQIHPIEFKKIEPDISNISALKIIRKVSTST